MLTPADMILGAQVLSDEAHMLDLRLAHETRGGMALPSIIAYGTAHLTCRRDALQRAANFLRQQALQTQAVPA